MTTAHDVAAFIEQRLGKLDPWKLQKLLYYVQGWSLAWDGDLLFHEKIEAWIEGPVIREVWVQREHIPDRPLGNPDALGSTERDTVDAVLDFYGHLSGRQLVELSHREDPWKIARSELARWEKSQNPVTRQSLQAYFSKQATGGGKRVSDAVRRGVWVLLQLPEDSIDQLMKASDRADEFNSWLDGPEDAVWHE